MLERIGDLAQSQRITDTLLQAQTRSRELQAQLGSGKFASAFADIAPDAERLLAAKSSLGAAGAYIKNNDLVNARLSVMESSIEQIFDLGTRARTLLVQRLSDGAGVPGVIEPEAQLMLEQAVAALNVDLDGRHLFAGSRTDTPPVVLDPAFVNFGNADDTYYQGDDVELTARADDDIAFTYGMTADREGFQELIGGLRTVIESDAIDDEAQLENALDLIDGAMAKIADYRGELGASQARLDDINEIHRDAELFLQQTISEVEDVDITEAVTRLTQQQIVIESAMATIGRLSQLSLADFLR